MPTKKITDTMEEHDKKSKLIMWSKINEFISDGLKISQISRKLGLHRQTVSHYASMTFEEFQNSTSYQREYAHKLDIYEEYVLQLLGKYPFVSAAQVHDRLREHYPDMEKVSEKTVFNFVKRLRLTHDIPKEEEGAPRQMCKLPETEYGKYAQVDFGERWMSRGDGSRVKVYFMVMVLSRSRYKFVYFSLTPFNTERAVYAHELGFQYYGGKPKKLIYDQDTLFIKDENLGDYRLTAKFRAFCTSEKLEVIFCRKSDPQSKGKVENAVKYVKNNFLSAREFTGIDTLNKEALAWLERTANGTMHKGIRQLPADVFATEREWLTPYNGTPTLVEDRMERRLVRQDNTLMYNGNFYSLPCGTYRGKKTEVYVEEKEGVLHIYDMETGKTIASHTVCMQKGKTVSNANHQRHPSATLEDYAWEVTRLMPADSAVRGWMEKMRADRGRYYRDSLRVLERGYWKYSESTITDAFRTCLAKEVYNAHTLMEVAEGLRRSRNELPRTKPVDLSELGGALPKEQTTPEKSKVTTYQAIVEGAV